MHPTRCRNLATYILLYWQSATSDQLDQAWVNAPVIPSDG